MRFIIRGKLQRLADLPLADLPAHAVPYDEPDTLEGIARAAMPWHLPVLGIIIAAIALYRLWHGIWFIPTVSGLLLVFPLVAVHELLHALAMPRHSVVQCFWNFSYGMAMVTTNTPMRKRRFIIVSLAPFVLIGLLPVLYWLVSAPGVFLGRTFMTAGSVMMLLSCGDLLNVWMTLRQVPNHAMVQLSGMHTYWYR